MAPRDSNWYLVLQKEKRDPQRETDLPEAIVKVVSERAGKMTMIMGTLAKGWWW